ncbi:MAG: B12-binding domain-containing radical SAM protein [Syntrophaceae bacterium]|nr:B12-binding domain-containing radical SAM protein [Syntrophaceae bacterium]
MGGIPRKYSRYGFSPRLVEDRLKKMARPDLVLVTSFMTYWYPGVIETISLIRSAWKSVPVVLGGIYATLCTEHAIRYSGADLVHPGDGIATLPALLEEVFAERHEPSKCTDTLDNLPYPAFDLLPYLDQIPILTSRGCPFRCTYCASRRMEPRFRRRSPQAVADEIVYWHERFGISDFSFYDDALLTNPKEMILPLIREMIRRNLLCRFHCPNGLHLRDVDEELSRQLFRAGFKTLRFGFETADADRQRETGGKACSGDLKNAMECLRKAGYRDGEVGVYLLCGLPGQGVAEIGEGIDFVRSCGARPILAEYSPIPGTELWDQAVSVSPYPIAEEPLFHNNTLLPCAEKELTLPVFRELKRRALAPD